MNNMLNNNHHGVVKKGEITNYNIDSKHVIAESKNGLLIQLSPTYRCWISKKFIRVSLYSPTYTNFGISTTFDYQLIQGDDETTAISGEHLITFLNDTETYHILAIKVVKKNVVHQVQIPK